MTEAVLIALVAGGAGLIGAIVGGATSLLTTYLGPKWERTRSEASEFRERRRAAIIEWIDASQRVANAAVRKAADTPERSADFNLALSQLTSLLSADEAPVDNFLHGVGSYAGTFKTNRGARALVIANAGRMLIAWHRGSLPMSALKPFKLIHASGLNKSSVTFTSNWGDAVDGEVQDDPNPAVVE
ncbi:hypothetical protein PTQ19_10270 [Microbacterium esteraromaticum]|uniref:hypothetical protein n=1 Tax=Microbacterium esteraromaticum TaxID=57043 RepID=UPI002368E003|nr:hypothetical protein [Microbacterium esteraromaticum]WDH77906.1 hypothetical protein PTQ19_10270 [Microbacterium esteraromaticum]